ncbi:W2 domain containing protein [Trema orientale]|uniref:W2 domain containing protein n=1 Tax=Trema orientale TaxID=63057 RepID=A0A2P5EIY6_TREOI|nr:W2 domain containing protein [Trema orientale]
MADIGENRANKDHDEECGHSVAHIHAEELTEATDVVDDDMEIVPDGGILLPLEDLNLVEETFVRADFEKIEVDNVILEVNSLRLLYNKLNADCARAIIYSMMHLVLDTPSCELLPLAMHLIRKWKKLLKYYLADIDAEIKVILIFEEMCLEHAIEFFWSFTTLLFHLYDQEVIQEHAILRWDDEKRDADESDKIFVKQAEKFIQWLREAPEEDDDEDEEGDE